MYLTRFTRPFCSIRTETVVQLRRAIRDIHIGGCLDRRPLSRGRIINPTVTMSNVTSIHLWWSCRLWLSFTTRSTEAHTNPPSKDPAMQVQLWSSGWSRRGRWGIGSPELQQTHRKKCNARRQHESDLWPSLHDVKHLAEAHQDPAASLVSQDYTCHFSCGA